MSAPVFEAPFPVATPAPRTSRLPAFLTNAIDRLGAARDALNLPEPGKAEDLGREVKSEYSANTLPPPSTPTSVLQIPS